jgi:hypothetical protein
MRYNNDMCCTTMICNVQASKEHLAAVEEAQLAQTTKERAARLHERRRLDDLANQRRMQTVSTCSLNYHNIATCYVCSAAVVAVLVL